MSRENKLSKDIINLEDSSSLKTKPTEIEAKKTKNSFDTSYLFDTSYYLKALNDSINIDNINETSEFLLFISY